MLNGRFDRQERLAPGGMGQVWRSVDTALGRTVALKMLLPDFAKDPARVERFRREALAMARINHPNVIDIYDVYPTDEGPCIVMEYVDGPSLSQALARQGRLSPAETMRIVAQAADALDAAHRVGIVHRDIKPGNLLIRRHDGSVALTDFGIAQTPTGNVLTAVGELWGTPTYMAPEVLQGGSATPRSDVYSLGVVAYECLAGRAPFQAESGMAVALMHVEKAPPPLPPDVPVAVRALIQRALAKDPEHRPASAAELAQLARQAARDAAPPAPTKQEAPVTPPPARRRSGRLVLGFTLVATVVAVAAAAALNAYADRDDPVAPKTPEMPADLRAFAPQWPYEKCRRDAKPADDQDERWSCALDDTTNLFLIRYKTVADRDKKYRANAKSELDPKSDAGWTRGKATAPGGATGRYLEFETNIGSKTEQDWQESIWWDNAPQQPDSRLALVLRTKRIPDARQAMDRIRGYWDGAGYTRPSATS